MPGKVRAESPEVIAKAERLGVDLRAVSSTGEGDRVTGDDVFRAAVAAKLGLPGTASVPEVMAAFTAVTTVRKRREDATKVRDEAAARAALAREATSARPSVDARGPAWAHNPLVDQVRALAAARHDAAPSPPAPTLFAAGDCPSFTARGIPANSVLTVPWQARHPLAAAPTAADAYAIVNECSGADGAAVAAMLYADHDENVDYAGRVAAWQVASKTDDELFDSLLPGAREEQDRRLFSRAAVAG